MVASIMCLRAVDDSLAQQHPPAVGAPNVRQQLQHQMEQELDGEI